MGDVDFPKEKDGVCSTHPEPPVHTSGQAGNDHKKVRAEFSTRHDKVGQKSFYFLLDIMIFFLFIGVFFFLKFHRFFDQIETTTLQ